MPTASVLLRDLRPYRRDLFCAGLEALGYTISSRHLPAPKPDDLLLIWNRNRGNEGTAARYEAAGVALLIAENGYLPYGETKQFSLALSRHNGAGFWRPRPKPRFPLWPVKPWREGGEHILVLPQRGIGEIGVRMPLGWGGRVAARLREMTSRPIIIRPHPGMNDRRPIDVDLAGAWCAVTWGSGAALKAIVAGVPVFYDLPCWIGHEAARPMSVCNHVEIEQPFMGDRAAMLATLSWAQWGEGEIADGTAFRHVLGR